MITSVSQQEHHNKEKWFVLRTTPRGDKAAVCEFAKAGFQAFSATAPIHHVGSKLEKHCPLFPGYIFLQCDIDMGSRPSLEIAPHASHWVKCDGEIYPVPDSSIRDIQDHVSTWNTNGGIWHAYQAGDDVIVSVNDSIIPGKVLETVKSPNSKVKVSLQFANNFVSAEAPYDKITPKTEIPQHLPRRTRGKRRWIKQSTRIG